MYTHIEGNIYLIPVPLPDNPLRNLNSYVIRAEGGGRHLLIDTGFRRDECRDALLAGLGELDVRLEDTDIFLTHLHSDHTSRTARGSSASVPRRTPTAWTNIRPSAFRRRR